MRSSQVTYAFVFWQQVCSSPVINVFIFSDKCIPLQQQMGLPLATNAFQMRYRYSLSLTSTVGDVRLYMAMYYVCNNTRVHLYVVCSPIVFNVHIFVLYMHMYIPTHIYTCTCPLPHTHTHMQYYVLDRLWK